jgi:hypothetical protein
MTALIHDSADAVIEAGKGVEEADWIHLPMLAASRRTQRSPPSHGNWPASRAPTVASRSMLAIAVQPAAAADQEARARSERAGTAGAGAQGRQPMGTVDGGHKVPVVGRHHVIAACDGERGA